MSNNLEKIILDQHARVKSAGENGHEVLGEAKGEILGVATPEQVQEILDHTLDVAMLSADPMSSHLAGVRDPSSLPRSLARIGGRLYNFSASGLLVPDQGYLGLVYLDASGKADGVFGFSAAHGQKLQEEDPIQEACGPDFFYPPMMWAKALYSEAYKNRADSLKALNVHQWVASLIGEGIFQGSVHVGGGVMGSTGFMPSASMKSKLAEDPSRAAHIGGEEIEAFQASGLMDCATLGSVYYEQGIGEENIILVADEILEKGGSLN